MFILIIISLIQYLGYTIVQLFWKKPKQVVYNILMNKYKLKNTLKLIHKYVTNKKYITNKTSQFTVI